MKRILYITALIIALFVGVTFTIQNRQAVEIGYYFGWRWAGPLSLALLTTFLLGMIAGYLASLRMVVRMQRQLAQARKEIRQVEQEVQNLRTLPIKDVL
ncbi:MAG: hypothetical protein A2637_08095 [Candidatus Muproteobacteria bacterium RIFCSPHIGHO2_01_FULL_65_16]|uniref:Lipopolysaccharide assembly protein A domain-containing protein n=3 Tax=Candidatus Muproteobacteria TaxID=1817795 RepID=A0A1F6TFT1_9PROT|nr:MAG: hypothetical protein A2V92_05255 [Candidatus Muproteobacteria bacterium RBG_16_65_31]OGI45247.1 MAG: hypothetical protein A2637_08095 [Candidatus Muproteobacteria bacterium RIFCSPHIGHO2_01_FULL_65_16]OGI49299.1 MAG: hypothetical protein A3B81_06990 [Candidatus Muproteobacteria bacterium RIFCSPHIGHO2_02_FULL_65_16]